MVFPPGASWDLLTEKRALGCLSQGLLLRPLSSRDVRGSRAADCSGTPAWGTPRILPSSTPLPPSPVVPRPHLLRPQGLGGSPELPVRSLPKHCFQKGLNKYVQQEGEPQLPLPAGGKLNNVHFCRCEPEQGWSGRGAEPGGGRDWQLVASPKSEQPMKFLIAGARLASADK